MRTAAVLLSHALTPDQVWELQKTWGADRIATLPAELRDRWSHVPPDGPFPGGWLQPVIRWLQHETEAGDLVVVQGEPGSVFCVVNWCFAQGRVPLYATTTREAQEEQMPDGSVVTRRVFRHRNFRAYPAPAGSASGGTAW